MKKALIPAAILLTLAGAAHAELSLYGLIDLSYGKNETLGDTKADFHSGGDNGSSQGNSTTRFGLKGSTDVGSGLKANFKLESGGIGSDGEITSSSGALFDRQAWAGLSGSFGEVRLGRQDSVAFQTMIGFDFNGAANAASAFYNAGVGPWMPGRQSRSLQYISPEMAGLKLQLGMQPAGNNSDDPTIMAKTNASLGLTYTMGALSLAVTGESARTEGGEGFASFAAAYDFGVAKAMVSYADGGDMGMDDAGNATGSGKGYGVGVMAPVAGYTVGVNFGRNSDTKVKATEIFVNREVLKNTIVYLDLGKRDDGTDTQNVYALGVIYTF